MASLPNPSDEEWQEVRKKIKGKRLEEKSPSTFARQARSSTATTSKHFSTLATSKPSSTANTVKNSSTINTSQGSSNGPLPSQRKRGGRRRGKKQGRGASSQTQPQSRTVIDTTSNQYKAVGQLPLPAPPVYPAGPLPSSERKAFSYKDVLNSKEAADLAIVSDIAVVDAVAADEIIKPTIEDSLVFGSYSSATPTQTPGASMVEQVESHLGGVEKKRTLSATAPPIKPLNFVFGNFIVEDPVNQVEVGPNEGSVDRNFQDGASTSINPYINQVVLAEGPIYQDFRDGDSTLPYPDTAVGAELVAFPQNHHSLTNNPSINPSNVKSHINLLRSRRGLNPNAEPFIPASKRASTTVYYGNYVAAPRTDRHRDDVLTGGVAAPTHEDGEHDGEHLVAEHTEGIVTPTHGDGEDLVSKSTEVAAAPAHEDGDDFVSKSTEVIGAPAHEDDEHMKILAHEDVDRLAAESIESVVEACAPEDNDHLAPESAKVVLAWGDYPE